MSSLLETLLGFEGFMVVQGGLSNDDDILAKIQAEQPDVILLDVHLKNADGIAIMSKLRRMETLSRTRVIMTSGMAVGERCLQAGADAFLMKPYMPSELIALIRANLKQ